MSAVSTGPEEAGPGSVRPPLLCTLLQAAHQVDWRSSDHLQPCEMQTLPQCLHSYRTCFSTSCVLVSAHLWEVLPPKINYFVQTHPSLDWTLIVRSLNHQDLSLLTHSKGVHFLFHCFVLSVVLLFMNALWMHYECTALITLCLMILTFNSVTNQIVTVKGIKLC